MKQSKTLEYKVGQQLWFVEGTNRRRSYYVTIEQIGRKYLSLEKGMKLDLETLTEVTEYAPGRAWLTKEEYETEVNIQRAWSDLRRLLDGQYQPPKDVSSDDIINAKLLLKL